MSKTEGRQLANEVLIKELQIVFSDVASVPLLRTREENYGNKEQGTNSVLLLE
jgi:hypothetical protein